jgi:hypothetical protein
MLLGQEFVRTQLDPRITLGEVLRLGPVRRGASSIQQPGLRQQVIAGAESREDGAGLVLAPQRLRQGVHLLAVRHEGIHGRDERRGHHDRVGPEARIDFAIHRDSLPEAAITGAPSNDSTDQVNFWNGPPPTPTPLAPRLLAAVKTSTGPAMPEARMPS